ncbi:amino acid permease-domain-containing protein [Blastocladiella britannica]|nr:amino acid permease-domain-containing protein [Blastocladiella britannica]
MAPLPHGKQGGFSPSPVGSTLGVVSAAAPDQLVADRQNAEYLARRKLPEPFAGHWDLWSYVVGIVISGFFVGWQSGILYGWANLHVAFVFSTIMYLALVVSVSELASALPFASGPAAFAQAAFNTGTGAFTGIIYTLSYVVLSASGLISLANFIVTLFPGAENVPTVIWWILISLVLVAVEWSPKFFFRSTLVLSIYSCLLLVAYAIAMMVFGKEAFPAGNTNTEGAIRVSSCPMGDGPSAAVSMKGVIQAFPYASWFYLGIEAFPVTAEETTSNLYAGKMPKSVVAATAMLFVFSILCLVTGPLASDPYLATFALTDHPLLDRVIKLACARMTNAMTSFPDYCDPASLSDGAFAVPAGPGTAVLIALTLLPTIFVSLTTSTYAAARHVYTLSRMGVLPTRISITTKHGSPVYSTVLTCILQVAITQLVQTGYDVAAASDTSSETSDPLCPSGGSLLSLNILKVTAWVGCATYFVEFLAYIIVRRRLPTLPRPFTSPLGRPGAAVGGLIALVFGIVGPATTSVDDLAFYGALAVISIAIMIVFAIYWRLVAKARTALSPEKMFVRRQLEKLWNHQLRPHRANTASHQPQDMSQVTSAVLASNISKDPVTSINRASISPLVVRSAALVSPTAVDTNQGT